MASLLSQLYTLRTTGRFRPKRTCLGNCLLRLVPIRDDTFDLLHSWTPSRPPLRPRILLLGSLRQKGQVASIGAAIPTTCTRLRPMPMYLDDLVMHVHKPPAAKARTAKPYGSIIFPSSMSAVQRRRNEDSERGKMC